MTDVGGRLKKNKIMVSANVRVKGWDEAVSGLGLLYGEY